MPRTKSRPKPATSATPPTSARAQGSEQAAEVLTLAEAAAYLRVPEVEVVRLVCQQDLPGRLVGTEWRFLKSALQDWLRTPPPKPSKEAVLARVGSWKDDPYLEEMLKEIYKQRGRPETEDAE
jgi:excisionase family DNA binding protein